MRRQGDRFVCVMQYFKFTQRKTHFFFFKSCVSVYKIHFTLPSLSFYLMLLLCKKKRRKKTMLVFSTTLKSSSKGQGVCLTRYFKGICYSKLAYMYYSAKSLCLIHTPTAWVNKLLFLGSLITLRYQEKYKKCHVAIKHRGNGHNNVLFMRGNRFAILKYHLKKVRGLALYITNAFACDHVH